MIDQGQDNQVAEHADAERQNAADQFNGLHITLSRPHLRIQGLMRRLRLLASSNRRRYRCHREPAPDFAMALGSAIRRASSAEDEKRLKKDEVGRLNQLAVAF